MNVFLQHTLKLFLILSIYCIMLADARNKYNVSLVEMATCEEYVLRGTGYTYTDFFLVHSLNNNKLRPDERLHLKFYVMTNMDAHILLSVNNRPRLLDRVYEIVIGAGGNSFSTIRTSMGRRRVATSMESNLLSLFDATPIEIVQMKDGNLLVYIPGFKDTALLNFTDASPLNINYVSFSTFGSINAKWFYDCQFDGYADEMEEEKRPETPLQRLVANLTAKAAGLTVPESLSTVDFAFQMRGVSFLEKTSILHTRLNLILYWSDAMLQWNPADFGGIQAVVQPDLDIWIPKIIVLNGALETLRDFLPAYEIKVFANGSVILMATNAELKTWCLNSGVTWPSETLRCELDLGLDDGDVHLQFDTSKDLSREPISTLSEWQCLELRVSTITNGLMERVTDHGTTQIIEGDVAVEFKLVRNSDFYKNIYTTPLLACQTLIILSFLLRGYRRGALLLVVLIVISLGLMFMTKHAPPAYIPNIMIAYQHVMRIATFCYVLHIIIMWLEQHAPTAKPPHLIMSIINSSPLRLLLCMRFSDSTEYVDIQEHPWREIAKIINNICFIVINIAFILIIVLLLSSA